MEGFTLRLRVHGLFRIVKDRRSKGILAIAPPTRLLSTDIAEHEAARRNKRKTRIDPDEWKRRLRTLPHEFYVEWDRFATRSGHGGAFPSMHNIWNVRGTRVSLEIDPAPAPGTDFRPDRLRLPMFVPEGRTSCAAFPRDAADPSKVRAMVRCKASALRGPGEFGPPTVDPDYEVTAERVVGQLLVQGGKAVAGDQVNLRSWYEPDLMRGDYEAPDLNNGFFVEYRDVTGVTVHAHDLITGALRGSVPLDAPSGTTLDVWVKHICPEFVLRQEPERRLRRRARRRSRVTLDEDFVWLYELSRDVDGLRKLVERKTKGSRCLPVPARMGDPEGEAPLECGGGYGGG